jgi:glycosyltransferase involved in cell wall biosynthesis
VCEDERRLAIDNGIVVADSAFVIYNSIDVASADNHRLPDPRLRRKIGLDGVRFVVGTVADLRPQKGLRHFIRAAKLVAEEREDVGFLVVGSGSLFADLSLLVSDCGLEERVRIVAGEEAIWKYYALMDIFVLTSLWEGFPYAILEAMAMRKPVVATSVTGSREAVIEGKTGLLVPARDERAIARAALRLLDDAGLRDEMGAEGRRAIERNHLIQHRIKELEDVYERLHDTQTRERSKT